MRARGFVATLLALTGASIAGAQEEPPPPVETSGPEIPRASDENPPPVVIAPARCIPSSCQVQGSTCGRIPDGCGGMIDCGECPPPPPREPLGFRLSLSLDWVLMDPLSPGVGAPGVTGERLPMSLFTDGWDPRYTGYEDVSHALFHRRLNRGRLTFDVAIAVRVLSATIDTNIDDSSYLRVAIQLDRARSLAVTLFPLSSDRMRLGYGYRTSWGGSSIFFKGVPNLGTGAQPPAPNTLPDPGLRLQYVDGRVTAWTGFKMSGLLNRNPSVNEIQAVYAALGGVAVDAIPDRLRIEVGAGYFDRGTNQNFYAVQMAPYVDRPLDTYGVSAQISLWNGLPPSLSLDYGRYREDPTTAARLLAKPWSLRPGVVWLVQAEATTMSTALQDATDSKASANQVGWAAALNARLQHGHSRWKLDAIGRSVEFLLIDGPSLVPYQAFPPSVTSAELLASVGYDHWFEKLGLTLGASLIIDQPASFRSLSSSAQLCGNSGGTLCTAATIVLRSLGDYTILPPDSSGNPSSPVPMVAAKLTAREDFLDYFSALLTLYYLHDPNSTTLSQSPNGDGTYLRIFGPANTVGLFLTLQARF
jgi:hypothetical protein